jgi:hypothetical protein
MTWSFTDIIAVLIALTLVYFTFIRARRPAWIQIVVIIGILGAGYYMWFMDPRSAEEIKRDKLLYYPETGSY